MISRFTWIHSTSSHQRNFDARFAIILLVWRKAYSTRQSSAWYWVANLREVHSTSRTSKLGRLHGTKKMKSFLPSPIRWESCCIPESAEVAVEKLNCWPSSFGRWLLISFGVWNLSCYLLIQVRWNDMSFEELWIKIQKMLILNETPNSISHLRIYEKYCF